MAISRRKFVKTATLLTLSVGAPVKAAEAISWPNLQLGRDEIPIGSSTSFLDMRSFSRCLGTNFSLRDACAKTTSLNLIEVHDWRPTESLNEKECFSLIFRAADTTRLPQDTYSVEHHSLGQFAMFVVPIRGKGNSRYYEAVFNRWH